MKNYIKIFSNILIVGLFSSLLGNCGGFKSSEESRWIQTSCDQIEFVSQKQLEALTTANHEELDEAFIRPACPGFMAIIPESRNLNLTQMNTCLGGQSGSKKSGIPSIPEMTLSIEQKISSMMELVDEQHLETWVTDLTDPKEFPTRYHLSDAGQRVPYWIEQEFNKLIGDRDDVTVSLWTHKNTPQKSVVVEIKGTSTGEEEFVIIGGHEDSVNYTAPSSHDNHDRLAPGADDNASGIATMLEIFRVLMASNYRPEKTILFMAYAAEEIGLVGSQEIASSFKAQGANVSGVLQLDMSMYTGRNVTFNLGYISDFTSPELNVFAKDLHKKFFDQELQEGRCGYACSDHASWTAAGYPSAFIIETDIRGATSRIHSNDDIKDDLNYYYGAVFVKFGLSFVVGLSHKATGQ